MPARAWPTFKVREGEPLGARVKRCAAPACGNAWTASSILRLRTFATSAVFSYKSFDGNGNYAVGIPDQSIFPEIELDQIKRQMRLSISFS